MLLCCTWFSNAAHRTQVLGMPALSPTMTTGNLAKWHVKEGDQIAPGSLLADVETDKAVVAFENQDNG
jgi:pyruvate dehydrogenase E2 component (dihydrolipoamide acetyltransferase)